MGYSPRGHTERRLKRLSRQPWEEDSRQREEQVPCPGWSWWIWSTEES